MSTTEITLLVVIGVLVVFVLAFAYGVFRTFTQTLLVVEVDRERSAASLDKALDRLMAVDFDHYKAYQPPVGPAPVVEQEQEQEWVAWSGQQEAFPSINDRFREEG